MIGFLTADIRLIEFISPCASSFSHAQRTLAITPRPILSLARFFPPNFSGSVICRIFFIRKTEKDKVSQSRILQRQTSRELEPSKTNLRRIGAFKKSRRAQALREQNNQSCENSASSSPSLRSCVIRMDHSLTQSKRGLPFKSVTFFISDVPTIASTSTPSLLIQRIYS